MLKRLFLVNKNSPAEENRGCFSPIKIKPELFLGMFPGSESLLAVV